MNLFTGLNESQKEAASHIDGPMLILAGAGSGKTKTITTRLAYMIGEVGIPAINTLTLTFTNKAASVMKNRALSLLNSNENPLLCTFHKFGLLFLKLHIERLGRKNNFIIIDNDDSKKILKELINDDKTSPHQILQFISHFKNESKNVQDVFSDLELLKDNEIKHQALQKIAIYYQNYQEYLLKHNFVDFDDLLFLTNTLLENDQNFAKEQSSFYRYITVDEYQDTNALQYKILKNLCCVHENICVVGDDDQSIYSWRGAKIENILNFQSEFSNVKLVKLEQNYRSVGMILKAANNLISHNKKRLGKTLLCTKDEGKDVQILSSDNEKIESALVAKKIKELLNTGIYAGEIAVLFRINALSRSIEEAFMKEKIPYKLLSGMRFYERLEIKDLICYLRILINPNDDLSFKRIINRPKRSIGEKALQNLEDYAQKRKISLFEALCESDGGVGIFSLKKAQNEAKKFMQNIYKLREYSDLKKMIENFEELFALKEFYALQEDGDEHALNIDEFYASIKEKIKEEPQTTLEDILSEISLLSDQDGIEGECVYLMSVHASKGLEFDHVFIVGLEEGFFPLNESDIEEERRLAYVAITRAKKCLSLSIAKSRFYRGSRTELGSSRFLEESQLTKKISINKTEQGYHKGDLVKHKIFGIGRVISINKSAKEEKLTINFGGIERIIMASFVEKAV
ncbi:ATP-dependent helicase [Campylobacter coli]|nr:ATP-dependent helicase [Campylobacter coli]EAJ7403074.1 ATP-dependent helicase [Campylobacter coli]EED2625758.1 UvrD-helicase domain-containing protein [Campylobacter coli]EGK8155080.1 UvrD-helicase domain-containing protein [Campylobacter coli]HEA7231784.1 UvrD-helicase domain-containing protein [Campylobacter coli]